MIRLTLAGASPRHIFIPGEHIVDMMRAVDDASTLIATPAAPEGYRVIEQPLDVARARAAWERRYDTAAAVEGDLPICVSVKEDGDFQFYFCCHTAGRVAEAAEERAANGVQPPTGTTHEEILNYARSLVRQNHGLSVSFHSAMTEALAEVQPC